MNNLLDHPAVQGGLAPLVVALIVAALFARSRLAWLAIAAGYAVSVALVSGFAFSPLTVGRKIVIVAVLAGFVGLAADSMGRKSPVLAAVLALLAGLAAIWVFQTLLVQKPVPIAMAQGAGMVAFIAVLVWLTQWSRDSGLRVAATGLGLGLGSGIAAFLSASIGFLLTGVAVAASAGALLLTQVAMRREMDAGNAGALSVAMPCAYFLCGTLMLAQLPWYALPIALLVPLAMLLPMPRGNAVIARATLAAVYAIVAGALVAAAAWFATRGA